MKSWFTSLSLALTLVLGGLVSAPVLAASPPDSNSSMAPRAPIPVFDAATLAAYDWRLIQARDHNDLVIAGLQLNTAPPLRLSFSRDNLNISGGCNMLFGSYTLASGAIQIGPLAGTRRACESSLMQRDTAIAARLEGRLMGQVDGGATAPRLMLTTKDGDRLMFLGDPTPQTRTGSQGKLMFLEVSSATVACNHPLIPGHRCLRVRERQFNTDGILQPPRSAWRLLYQSIEGYDHAEGEHAILRVKRYAWKNPPADAPDALYVLDLVVQRGG